MSSRKRNSLIMLIIVAVLGVAVIVSAILLILQRVGGLESISISPSFAEVELDVNKDYYVAITTDPESKKGKVSDFEVICDSSAATFEISEDGTGVIHTNGEGEVTIYVKYKGVESNRLTYRVVDLAAQAAQAAAEAQAQAEAEALAAQAEAEAAAAAEAQTVTYVRVTKDSVNVRPGASTDGDPVGKANKGDTFEVVSVEGEWTQIRFSGDTLGYIRNDMIETVSDGADATDAEAQAQPTEEKKEEAKNEEKPAEEKKDEKAEEQKKAEDEAKKAADAEAAAKAAEEEAKKQAEAAAKAAEEQAAAAAAAAAAAVPAATGSMPAAGPWVYQGVTFTANQVAHFHALWDYTGDAAEMATHHSAGELLKVCEVDGIH